MVTVAHGWVADGRPLAAAALWLRRGACAAAALPACRSLSCAVAVAAVRTGSCELSPPRPLHHHRPCSPSVVSTASLMSILVSVTSYVEMSAAIETARRCREAHQRLILLTEQQNLGAEQKVNVITVRGGRNSGSRVSQSEARSSTSPAGALPLLLIPQR